jgi:hypothetical protein
MSIAKNNTPRRKSSWGIIIKPQMQKIVLEILVDKNNEK